MTEAAIVFHVDLIQDVTVLRPLIRLAIELPFKRVILVSANFAALDNEGIWSAELAGVAAETGSDLVRYQTPLDAVRALHGLSGICIAGSESDVRAHRHSHELFRSMPASILRITLQHGFECLGFLHNRRHTETIGRDVHFAADIIVGWMHGRRLVDINPAQASKLYTAGPPQLIDPVSRGVPARPYVGLVCENTHSVRFSTPAMRRSFLGLVETIGGRLADLELYLNLRPHPAGQFVKRTQYEPEPGVVIADGPAYQVDFSQYAFGISAPSTILFDLMLAEVPVAIWRDPSVDVSNFGDLTCVETEEEAWRFVSASTIRRSEFLTRQNDFIGKLAIPERVRERYLDLLALAGTR